mmetsp:Transcript_22022/g.47878  ORF Transcript_22022/g.47878 Transcript_22022/m.47878 type:complete len:337 (-) Transcript_22022:1527-2537(-)
MITSFFAPKSKPGSKRSRKGEDDAENARSTKKRVVTPADSSVSATSSSSLTEETATLLSFLHQHNDDGLPTEMISWRGALEKYFATAKFTSLAKFMAKERASKTVYPPPQLVFAALNLTPLHKVKVVIVGQDPYHQPQQGHGLSFSVPPGIKIPPSLRNIYKELYNDDEVEAFSSIPQHGNLERWAKQGILLLNNVLTVRRGEAASHAKKGWEDFTEKVIGAVIERDGESNSKGELDNDAEGNGDEKGTGVVFLLWGKPASLKAQTILAKYNNKKRAKHAVIMCSHPSPLGATKTKSPFMGSKCFSRANEELVKRGWEPIDWRVDGPLDSGSLKEE